MNIEKYTQNAQQAVLDCQNIAVAMGNQMVDGEHIEYNYRRIKHKL